MNTTVLSHKSFPRIASTVAALGLLAGTGGLINLHTQDDMRTNNARHQLEDLHVPLHITLESLAKEIKISFAEVNGKITPLAHRPLSYQERFIADMVEQNLNYSYPNAKTEYAKKSELEQRDISEAFSLGTVLDSTQITPALRQWASANPKSGLAQGLASR